MYVSATEVGGKVLKKSRAIQSFREKETNLNRKKTGHAGAVSLVRSDGKLWRARN